MNSWIFFQKILHFNFRPNFFSVFFFLFFFKNSNWHVWRDSFNFIIKLQLLHFVLMNIACNYSNQLLWIRNSRRLIKTLSSNVECPKRTVAPYYPCLLYLLPWIWAHFFHLIIVIERTKTNKIQIQIYY